MTEHTCQEDEDRKRFEEERRREADVRKKLDTGLANALTEWTREVAKPFQSFKAAYWQQASSRTKRVQDEEGNWHGFDSEIGREV